MRSRMTFFISAFKKGSCVKESLEVFYQMAFSSMQSQPVGFNIQNICGLSWNNEIEFVLNEFMIIVVHGPLENCFVLILCPWTCKHLSYGFFEIVILILVCTCKALVWFDFPRSAVDKGEKSFKVVFAKKVHAFTSMQPKLEAAALLSSFLWTQRLRSGPLEKNFMTLKTEHLLFKVAFHYFTCIKEYGELEIVEFIFIEINRPGMK